MSVAVGRYLVLIQVESYLSNSSTISRLQRKDIAGLDLDEIIMIFLI